MVEFALVITLFVFVLYALIAYGLALSLKQNMTHAASEGARSAIGAVPGPGETQQQAQVRVAKATVDRAMSSYSQYDPTTVADVGTQFCAPNPPSATAQCIKVTITYPYNTKPIVPNAPGLGIVLPNTMTAKATVVVSQ